MDIATYRLVLRKRGEDVDKRSSGTFNRADIAFKKDLMRGKIVWYNQKKKDWHAHLKLNHPVYSIFTVPGHHPFGKGERAVVFVCNLGLAAFFAFMISIAMGEIKDPPCDQDIAQDKGEAVDTYCANAPEFVTLFLIEQAMSIGSGFIQSIIGGALKFCAVCPCCLKNSCPGCCRCCAQCIGRCGMCVWLTVVVIMTAYFSWVAWKNDTFTEFWVSFLLSCTYGWIWSFCVLTCCFNRKWKKEKNDEKKLAKFKVTYRDYEQCRNGLQMVSQYSLSTAPMSPISTTPSLKLGDVSSVSAIDLQSEHSLKASEQEMASYIAGRNYNRTKPNQDDFKEIQDIFNRSTQRFKKNQRRKQASITWKRIKKDPYWKQTIYHLRQQHLGADAVRTSIAPQGSPQIIYVVTDSNRGTPQPSPSPQPVTPVTPHKILPLKQPSNTKPNQHLPKGWRGCTTADGKLYYQNDITKETQWHKPGTPAPSKPPNDGLPKGWKKYTTDGGKVYYHNENTKETQWTKPGQPAPPKDDGLPKGWKKWTTTDGKVYYHNASTKETRWTKPGTPVPPKDDGLPDGWKKYTSDEGKVYYHNDSTNETQWNKPGVTPKQPPPPAFDLNAIEITPKAKPQPPAQRRSMIAMQLQNENLVQGWKVKLTPDGRVFYQNESTKEIQWDKPTATPAIDNKSEAEAPPPSFDSNAVEIKTETPAQPQRESKISIVIEPQNGDLPKGWKMKKTPDGKVYYQNESTKEIQWNKPAASPSDDEPQQEAPPPSFDPNATEIEPKPTAVNESEPEAPPPSFDPNSVEIQPEPPAQPQPQPPAQSPTYNEPEHEEPPPSFGPNATKIEPDPQIEIQSENEIDEESESNLSLSLASEIANDILSDDEILGAFDQNIADSVPQPQPQPSIESIEAELDQNTKEAVPPFVDEEAPPPAFDPDAAADSESEPQAPPPPLPSIIEYTASTNL